MPRLTTTHYLQPNHRLRKLWLKDHGLFAELTPVEQWMLHDFFKPDVDLTDEQLIAHRKRVTAERPGLPQQAGKALARFDQLPKTKTPATQDRPTSGRKSQSFILKPIVNPVPDAKKLARAFWMLAEQLNEQQGSAPKHKTSADENDQSRSRP